MTDLFISYARHDHQQARRLATAMESAGYSVWWDRQLLSGDEFSAQIEQALTAAKAVLVCWSSDASKSRWVRDEASLAADSGKLISISLDGSEPPMGFRQYHFEDLSNWRDNADNSALQQLIRAVNARLDPDKPIAGAAPMPDKPKVNNRIGPVAAVLAVVALVAIGVTALRPTEDGVKPQSATPPPAAAETSTALADTSGERLRTIAVLPFDNYSPNSEDAYFAAGITEEITGQLARIGDLTVLSRVAVARAVEAGGSLEDIANALGAGSVLEGSVRMAGPQVRITAQLIEVASQQHLWSNNFDRELTDIFQIQTDVALAIGDALLAQLSSGERAHIQTPATGDIRAYQLFLKQQELLATVPEENQQAMDLLEQALRLDPGYAEAQARLSWRYTWESRVTGDRAAAERAEQLALEALTQDPQLAQGSYALGSALGELERMEEMGIAMERAYQLDPNHGSTLTDISFYYATMGRPAEGLEIALKAVRLNPNDPNIRWHAVMPLLFLGDRERMEGWLQLARDEGMAFHRLAAAQADLALLSGNPNQAAAIARRMGEGYPDSREAQLLSRYLLFLTGNWREISEELLALGRESPNAWALPQLAPRSKRVIRGFVLAEQGQEAAARRVFDDALEASRIAVERGSTLQGRALDAASVYAYRGDQDSALRELERAYELGLRADFVLAVDPFFVSLRGMSRFDALLERIADSQREQREVARLDGALEGYDRMISAGPAGVR
ncbi:MAG: TIR domain-containing protein [Lysobacterales bacterium]